MQDSKRPPAGPGDAHRALDAGPAGPTTRRSGARPPPILLVGPPSLITQAAVGILLDRLTAGPKQGSGGRVVSVGFLEASQQENLVKLLQEGMRRDTNPPQLVGRFLDRCVGFGRQRLVGWNRDRLLDRSLSAGRFRRCRFFGDALLLGGLFLSARLGRHDCPDPSWPRLDPSATRRKASFVESERWVSQSVHSGGERFDFLPDLSLKLPPDDGSPRLTSSNGCRQPFGSGESESRTMASFGARRPRLPWKERALLSGLSSG